MRSPDVTAGVPIFALALAPPVVDPRASAAAEVAADPPAGSGAAVRDDEPRLIELALRGRREAWNALIARHSHRVVVALLARGVPLERARDLAQDAWLRLIEQQARGNLRELVLPGLAVTQALFLARDDARRRRPAPLGAAAHTGAEEDHAAAAPVVDPAASVEERLLRGEQLARAARALAECHPTAQRVFRLVYENPDAQYADVAREVGLSLQRVRQIVCEVRKKLRAAIEGDVHV